MGRARGPAAPADDDRDRDDDVRFVEQAARVLVADDDALFTLGKDKSAVNAAAVNAAAAVAMMMLMCSSSLLFSIVVLAVMLVGNKNIIDIVVSRRAL